MPFRQSSSKAASSSEASVPREDVCSFCTEAWFPRQSGTTRRSGRKRKLEDPFPLAKCGQCARAFHVKCLKDHKLVNLSIRPRAKKSRRKSASKQSKRGRGRHLRDEEKESDSHSECDSVSECDSEYSDEEEVEWESEDEFVCSQVSQQSRDSERCAAAAKAKAKRSRQKRGRSKSVSIRSAKTQSLASGSLMAARMQVDCEHSLCECIDASSSVLRTFQVSERVRYEQVQTQHTKARVWRRFYQWFQWKKVRYTIGDFIEVFMSNDETDVGFIREIYCDDKQVGVRLLVEWFLSKRMWHEKMDSPSKKRSVGKGMGKAKSKSSMAAPSAADSEDWTESDLAELYLCREWTDTVNVTSVIRKAFVHSSHKEWHNAVASAKLVVEDSADFKGKGTDAQNAYGYYYSDHTSVNHYFCTHGFDYAKRRKCRLPEGLIERMSNGTQFSPMGSSKSSKTGGRSRKRKRGEVFEEDLRDAADKLQLAAVPSVLRCRETEREYIRNFMFNAIKQKGCGSGLYISGMPGTGKTATVRQIARELAALSTEGEEDTAAKPKRTKRAKKKGSDNSDLSELPSFRFEQINGMKMPTPQHAYSEVYKLVSGKYCAQKVAVRKLDEFFSKKDPTREVLVLLVDELDYLLTRKQQVIYNLFNWPTYAWAHLVVLGIANTMDLPERLIPRVSSRLGVERIIFTPYSRPQLKEIIGARLTETKVFNEDAISFCASSVAAVSGDCRRALQICRRAVDIARKRVSGGAPPNETQSKGPNNSKKKQKTAKSSTAAGNALDHQWHTVTLLDIKAARDCFIRSDDVQILSGLRLFEQIFLTAVVVHNIQHKSLSAAQRSYKHRMDSYMSSVLGMSALSRLEMSEMLDRLQNRGVVSVVFNRTEMGNFVRLNCQESDVIDALSRNPDCDRIISQTGVGDY